MSERRLYLASEMRAADEHAVSLGVPLDELMRAAGVAVAREALRRYPAARAALVLCGPGNNGGDGYVAALELKRRGLSVTMLELGASGRSGPAARARAAYTRSNDSRQPGALTLKEFRRALLTLGENHAARDAAPRLLVIDALFGSGLARPLTLEAARVAESASPFAREAGAAVVSIDVPSGLNADSAEAAWPHVRADLTVVLAGHKPAGLFFPARASFGEVTLADIGMPQAALMAASDTRIISAASLRALLPRRKPSNHKYDSGAVLVIAGSERYLGAAELACRGAWRGGAGVVTLVSAARPPGSWPETIHLPHDFGAPSAEWPPPGLGERYARSAVIGPGLTEAALPHLARLISWVPSRLVIDAAALNPEALLAARAELKGRVAVITPHAGEAERLLAALDPGLKGLTGTVPLLAASELASRLGVVSLLKGPTTVIAAPDGRLAVSTRGGSALASAGTGDVLAGLLGALLAAGGDSLVDAFELAALAAYLHGVAGEIAGAEQGGAAIASDVVNALRRAFLTLE